MKNTKVILVPLTPNDREQFILDNQWAFKYGAMMEFGERDNHLDFDGEILRIFLVVILSVLGMSNAKVYFLLCQNY